MSLATPFRGRVRGADQTRVAYGLGRKTQPALQGLDLLCADLQAWCLVLPPDAVFTHLTAAVLLGWWVPPLPEVIPVFAATREARRPRRPGLVCSRLTHPSQAITVRGLPIDSPVEILLRCARDLGTLDLAILVTSALRSRRVTRAELDEICATRRPGVRALRLAAAHAEVRCESGPEVMLTIFTGLAGIATEPQVRIFSRDGQFVARGDLLIRGTLDLLEYDGADHREVKQHQSDLRRDRRLADTAYRRRGFTLDDLLNHPLAMLQEIDRIVGRPHRARRVQRWKAWVRDSLYDVDGRERLVNRWRREMAAA